MSKQKIGYIIAGCFLILALIGYGCSRVTITKKQPANSESGAAAVTTTVTTVSSAKYDRHNPGGETTTEQGSTPTEGDVTTTKEVVTTTRKYDRRNPDAAMEQYTTTTAAATTVSLIESVDMVTVDAEIAAVAEDDKSSTGYSLTIKLLEGDDKGAFVIYNVDESLISKYKIGQKVRVTYELDEKKVVAVI